MTTTVLVLLDPDPQAPTRALRIDADDAIRDRVAVAPGDALPTAWSTADARIVVAVPGEDVTCVWLPLSAHSDAQARAAARLQLAPRIAAPVDALHVAVAGMGDARGDIGADRLLVGCTDVAMHAWRQRAATLGVQPAAVVPDCLLLPADHDGAVAVVVDIDRWLCRGADIAFSAEPALARVVLEGRPTREPSIAVEALLARGAVAPLAIDLLQGTHAPHVARADASPSVRLLAWLAAALLLSVPVLVAADALRYAVAASRLQSQSLALAAAVLPEARGGTAAQVRAALAERRAPFALAAARAALVDAVALQPGLRIERLEHQPGSGLQVTLRHPSPAAIDGLRTTLATRGLRLDAAGSVPADDGLRTDVVVSHDAGQAR